MFLSRFAMRNSIPTVLLEFRTKEPPDDASKVSVLQISLVEQPAGSDMRALFFGQEDAMNPKAKQSIDTNSLV
jgi:hypothetical protein